MSRSTSLTTVVAVTAIVYFLCCFLHEGIGHGGTASLQGIKVVRITNAYCKSNGGSELQGRLIASGGITINLCVGFVCAWMVRRRRSRTGGNWEYFLWLLSHINLFTAASYMATFAFIQMGDVHLVLRGLPGEMFLRLLVCITGVCLIVWTMIHAGKTLSSLLGHQSPRRKHAATLTFVPYLVGGILNVSVSLLDTSDISRSLILISSIGASMGGNFPMLFVPLCLPKTGTTIGSETSSPVRISPSYTWAVAGLVVAVFYVFLGMGINF